MILHFLLLFIFTACFILEAISSDIYVQLFIFSYTNKIQFYNQLIPLAFLMTDNCGLPEGLELFFSFGLYLPSIQLSACSV